MIPVLPSAIRIANSFDNNDLVLVRSVAENCIAKLGGEATVAEWRRQDLVRGGARNSEKIFSLMVTHTKYYEFMKQVI